ncbi:MAG: tyrosine-type recombinase/integrase [Candidatus Binatia bacterium]
MMRKAPKPENNLTHNVPAIVPALLERGKDSLKALAAVYVVTEVAGQAKATIAAKRRDLGRFFRFYEALYGHDRPEEWYASVTREFVRQEAKQGVSEATLARTYASVRHFARWVHHKVRAFPLGCPTDGVKPPQDPEPEWKGLSRADELRLLAAAQTLRVRPGRGTDQGLRDHAAIAVLLGSGLRVSELLGLDVGQYTGRGFKKVLAKGGRIRDVVPVKADAREVIEAWLAERGEKPGPIFTTRTGARLSREQFYKAMQRVVDQANVHRKAADRLEVSPHVLRHTFLRKLAEEKGVHYAKEASGHKSDRYIWRYVKPNTESLADAIDSLD